MRDNQLIPKEIGEFEIVRVVGQGSIGVVFEAREKSTNAQVTLKMFATWLGLTTNAYSKFEGMVESLAQANQPGCVSVHSCGQLGLRPYLVMTYIGGPSLDRIISRMGTSLGNTKRPVAATPLSLMGGPCPDWALEVFLEGSQDGHHSLSKLKGQSRAAHSPALRKRFDKIAEYFAEIADVLASTHRQGLIHGDIKPSNLLLTADKRACISDFGLARLLEQPGIVIGGKFSVSPVYCAPECLNSIRVPPNERADIYSLGAVLYEMLTLNRPYEGIQKRLASQIRRDDPRSPRSIDSRVPQDLETICRKAMERKPSQRYQSASQLADDLRKFASQQSISARRPGFAQRQLRWSVRHPTYAALWLGCLTTVGIATNFAVDFYQWSEVQYVERIDDELYQALLFSMVGDVGETERKVEALKEVEAEPWMLSLMLGQSKLIAGNLDDAIVDLNQVLQLRPESVSAMVLLAQAYADSARTEEQEETELKLATAAPTHIVDQLYLAHWLSQSDLRRAARKISDLRRSTDVHAEQLAVAFLTLAYCEIVQDTNDRLYMNASIGHSKVLSVPDEFAQLLQFLALKTTIEALHSSDTSASENYQKTMDEILVKIDHSYEDSLASARVWSWQAYTLDDPALRLQALQRSIELYKQNHARIPNDVSQAWALELFLQDRIQEAEQELNSLKKTGALDLEFLSAVILAQRDGDVKSATQELADTPRLGGGQAILQPVGYLMLGLPDKASEQYQKIHDLSPQWNATHHAWNHQLMRFTMGELSIEQILEAANQPGKSNIRSSQAHFHAGMRELAEGHRDQAKVYLEKCFKYGIFRSREFLYARAILEKWKTMPDWPAWIVSPAD